MMSKPEFKNARDALMALIEAQANGRWGGDDHLPMRSALLIAAEAINAAECLDDERWQVAAEILEERVSEPALRAAKSARGDYERA